MSIPSDSMGTVVAMAVMVVGPQFCAPHPVDLVVVRKLMKVSDGNFEVADLNGNVVFEVKGKLMSIHDHRVLFDTAGNPLLTIRQKVMSAHDRWMVYRGESNGEDKDLLFSVRRSTFFQLKKKLHVFLASNTTEEACDFRVECTWVARNCVVYAADSNIILAQMQKEESVKSVLLGKSKFNVTICPNVDAVFIIALVVVLDSITRQTFDD